MLSCCSFVQKLLLVQALRPDRLESACKSKNERARGRVGGEGESRGCVREGGGQEERERGRGMECGFNLICSSDAIRMRGIGSEVLGMYLAEPHATA
jgi:hypothetical protein